MDFKKIRIAISLVVVLAIVAVARPATPVHADNVTITYWDWWVAQGPTVDEGIKAFEAANPGITVQKTTQQDKDYTNLLNLAFQGDSAPDVFSVPEDQHLPFNTQIANGWEAPLDGLAGFSDWKASFPGQAFAEGINVIDGKTYSAPFFANLPNWQMYINVDLYKKAGLVNADGSLKLPKTLDDVMANSQVIKDKTGAYGLGFGNNVADWNFWMCQFSGGFEQDGKRGWDPKSGKFVFSTEPCFKTVINDLLSMQKNKLLLPDSTSIDDENARVRFANGEFAHLIGGTWVMGGWTTTNPKFTGADYTAVSLPLVGMDKPSSYWYVTPGGRQFAISATSKQQDAAWKFFKYLYSADFANLWAKDGQGGAYLTQNLPQYAQNDAQKAVYSMGNLVRVGPATVLRNPDAAKVQFSVPGTSVNDTVIGFMTGQITDVDKTLADLDKRSTDALNQAISDAASGGAKISLRDFVFSDWDPTKDYTTLPANAATAVATATAP